MTPTTTILMSPIAAGYSEDSDYTSEVNLPVNGLFPNAPASQYLQVSLPHTIRHKADTNLRAALWTSPVQPI